MKTIDIKELLIANPDIDEQAVIEGIQLTELLKAMPVQRASLEAEVPYSAPRVRVIDSPSQRCRLYLSSR